jgi:16S rRNA (cytidine1402-2'-O)-methyltransferase
MWGVLYVVATPIGHLGDITRRAEDVLKSVQIVAAEDTRRTRVLLDHIQHRAPELWSVHEHNEQAIAATLVARLREGVDIALVADAGTPLVNDPGYALVSAVWLAGGRVVPVPGASSITTALSVCPLPCHHWCYVGFLPAKAKARRELLASYLPRPEAIIFLEAPHRILATLRDIGELSDKRIMLGRELTKQFETLYVGTGEELISQLGGHPKGEIVAIVESKDIVQTNYEHERVLRILLQKLSPAQAAKLGARICSARKSDLYELAVKLQSEVEGKGDALDG